MRGKTLNSSQQIPLLDASGRLTPPRPSHYMDFPFNLPEGVNKITLRMTHHHRNQTQIFLSLHGPDGFRANRMNLVDTGEIITEIWITPDQASPGGLPGTIQPGAWKAQIDIAQLTEETSYRLVGFAEFGPAASIKLPFTDEASVSNIPPIKDCAGWYKGELHAHSIESDGKLTVEDMVTAASQAGLDFFALTDHFTCSQWRKLDALQDRRIALLHSLEITSHHGHANLHGLHVYVDVYVDRTGWSMDQAADSTHAQGGLFCVNHAYSADCSWRAFTFDWNKADLYEIFHNLEGPNNIYQIGLWDKLLSAGFRIIGVAGTDSHHPQTVNQGLGELVTWVYAAQLSEGGIVNGLKRGQAYISRGGELRFGAVNRAGCRVEMGERLNSQAGLIEFDVEVKTNQELKMYVVKNGYYFERFAIPAAPVWQTLTFNDQPDSPGYYRLEFHRILRDSRYPGIDWRDFSTIDMLSNPIWVALQ